MTYDYKQGKKRVEEILDNDLDIIEQDKVPKENEFTFSNGYLSWITAVFVDIRDSSSLCADEDKEKVAKIIKSFTSEIIEILRKDDNLREIGIRGDCVYAIYTTPKQEDEYEIANKTFFVNTYLKMLNMMLKERDLPTIKAGIGMSTAKELVVKAGRKDVGINSQIWIGKAVSVASNLASLGNKNGIAPCVYSELSYNNFIKEMEKNNSDRKPKDWFKYYKDEDVGDYYSANIVKIAFNDWIESGMIDE